MNIEKKKLTAALTSVLGIIIIGVLLVFVNMIFSPMNLRFDCTENKVYTLAEGTKNILSSLDRNVSIRFYYSKDAADMPVFLKTYASRVSDLLDEYKRHGKGKVEIKLLNPKPDSNEEDSAKLDGVTGQTINPLGNGEPVYLGIAIACGDKTFALPFLNPENESLLEYEITRAITEVRQSKKQRIGILSPLKVMGGIENPQMMMMGQGGLRPSWAFVKELKRSFDVVEIKTDADKIAEDIDLLLLVHPKELSEKTLFAIDQFVLRGGRLAALVDPLNMVDVQEQQKQQYMPPQGSDLAPLFKAWGIEYSPTKVVLDRGIAFHAQNRSGMQDIMPTVLNISDKELSDKDPVTTTLTSMLMFCTGFFGGTPAEGLTKSVLISATEDSKLEESYTAQRPGRELLTDFQPDNVPKAIAIRLTGTFKTAFPEGITAEGQQPAADLLKSSAKPGAVLLVADADFIYDPFCIQKANFLGKEIAQVINDNLNFLLNSIENLCGDSNLFQIRSRSVDNRPFERVRDIQTAAEKHYQSEIEKYERELASVQQSINELQRSRQDTQKNLLSTEQRQLLKEFRQKEVTARGELKKVRKQLRQDIDSLENRLTLVNIGLMPLLVIIGGILLAFCKRRKN